MMAVKSPNPVTISISLPPCVTDDFTTIFPWVDLDSLFLLRLENWILTATVTSAHCGLLCKL